MLSKEARRNIFPRYFKDKSFFIEGKLFSYSFFLKTVFADLFDVHNNLSKITSVK